MGAKGVSSSTRRFNKRTGGVYQPMAEINVTPFVDIMLVLLIVFMVTAPLLTVGVSIDLPETRAQQLQGDSDPLAISIKADGSVYLQSTEIAVDELVAKLLAIAENGYQERIFVRGDKNVSYGYVMRVMGTISDAGFRRVALVTELENEGQ
ncbi:MAG: protein TolR [Fimbriimonadaceae bacterium]|nr:protein TolR [Alphaproteobacteria bacterium]